MRKTAATFAEIDRQISERTTSAEDPRKANVSDIAAEPRWVLLGEPGSGKSATLQQAAETDGTSIVTARRFVEGTRPPGRTVFIDAFEEYRMGESARERLADLAAAIKDSPYEGWRIACRSITLPSSEVDFLAAELGPFRVWQLEPLDWGDVQVILKHVGEPDPVGFVKRIENVAAGSLLGNPATLVLLQETIASGMVDIVTRSDLMSAATERMAHELNRRMPEDPARPEFGGILRAAETACLVMLLSCREDISNSRKLPRHPCVTLTDLIPAGISTYALNFALDTPMFRGEANTFISAHRIVSEYLGGRALAHATDPGLDNRTGSALPVRRALALLCGDDDRPVPALTGLYAWFVTILAKTRHQRLALDFLKADPESVLFHGDAAALPTEHRRELLRVVGRTDPWFFSGSRGSTALAGLAGEDLAEELAAVAFDSRESLQRRAMVLTALATGRPVRTLAARLAAFAADPSAPDTLRRQAVDACVHMADEPIRVRRDVLTAVAGEPDGGPLMLRLHLIAPLVGISAGVGELRRVFADYAASGDGVMGYARRLGDTLVSTPIPSLFDEEIPGLHGAGARRIEVATLLDCAIAAAIATTPDLTAERLLRWIRNIRRSPFDQLRPETRGAVAAWLHRDQRSEIALFDEIVRSTPPLRRIGVAGEFHRISGCPLSAAARQTSVERLEALSETSPADASSSEAFREAATIACVLTCNNPDRPDLFDRVLAINASRQEQLAGTLSWLLTPVADTWTDECDADKADEEAARTLNRAADRKFVADNRSLVQSGKHLRYLVLGAQVSLGERFLEMGSPTDEPLLSWFGADGASDIRAGWQALATDFPLSPAAQGHAATRSVIANENWIAAAHAAELARLGVPQAMSLPYAFAVLCGSFLVPIPETRDTMREAAVDRIVLFPDGRDALADFWFEAMRSNVSELPHLRDFERRAKEISTVLTRLLQSWPNDRLPVLQNVVESAMRVMPRQDLLGLAEAARVRESQMHERRIWTLAAFLIEPGRHASAFQAEISDTSSHAPFERLYGTARRVNLTASPDESIERDDLVLSHLGPLHPPQARYGEGSDMGRYLRQAIESIAQSTSKLAGPCLRRLCDDAKLASWKDFLQHNAARHGEECRKRLFTVPLPLEVANALKSGPPAGPADLRAVVGEVLDELARDIRHGPTSAWRSFWNRPTGARNSPRIENECRDLLADRLSDRLAPFSIPVDHPVLTEMRSENDRRVDMVVLGKGAAALPIEVKRHWNRELWTAPLEQLEPYARSLDASGHGIYLVLWFGSSRPVPKVWPGAVPIRSAQALQAALTAHLPPEKRAKFDVLVFDVSEQETITASKRTRRKAATAKVASGNKFGNGRSAKGNTGVGKSR
jgi:hypothetical protein